MRQASANNDERNSEAQGVGERRVDEDGQSIHRGKECPKAQGEDFESDRGRAGGVTPVGQPPE